MFAALSLRIGATSDGSEDLDKLLICPLPSATCILAWQGLTRPAGGFGSRALLRYPKIDFKMEIPRTSKWLVALELFVHEARQRNCSKLEDKVLAPLAFALHEKFVPESLDFPPFEREARRLIDCRFPVTELYPKFTRFMIESMANLDILSRACRDTLPRDATDELNLPSWVPPFEKAGTTSLIDDLLFTRYNAAIYLGPYCKVESKRFLGDFWNSLTSKSIGCRAEASELPVQAIFFGRIVQISKYAEPADTIPTWLSQVCNSERYKQEVELGNRGDLTNVVTQNLRKRLALGIKWEEEWQKRKKEYLESRLSLISSIQLNTPVSIYACHLDRFPEIPMATKSARTADSASHRYHEELREDCFASTYTGSP